MPGDDASPAAQSLAARMLEFRPGRSREVGSFEQHAVAVIWRPLAGAWIALLRRAVVLAQSTAEPGSSWVHAGPTSSSQDPTRSELPSVTRRTLSVSLGPVAVVVLLLGCATPPSRPIRGRLEQADRSLNSNVLYRQEAVHDLRWNTQIHYTAEALKANPGLQNGFLHPGLNTRYTELNTGRTQFAMFGQVTNPVPAVLASSLEHLTGLAVPPSDVGSCQIGVDGGPDKGTNALQAHGTALGVSLAPRALTDRPFLHGVYGLYNWANPVTPFARSPADRLRVEGYFRHPYAAVKPVAEHLIAQEGTVFFYYTLQFRDTTQNRDLWFVVRLYQDKFARPSDPWVTLMDRDALAVDGTDPATSIGLIDAILRPGVTRVTPVPGSSYFGLAPFSGERYLAFELSGSQFRQALKDLNTARVAHVVFSEDPADYQLRHYNINVESWAPSPECDPRIGLSWRDIKVSMVF